MERHVNPEDPDLYALGALDGEEKRALEAHAHSCAACAHALEAAQERAALLGWLSPPVAPPPAGKEALMRRVRAERPSAAAGPAGVRDAAVDAAPAVRHSARLPLLNWLTPALGMATIVFAVLAGWLWMRNRAYIDQISALHAQLDAAQVQTQEIARTAAETDHLLGMPGTVRVALAAQPGGPSGRGGVLYNAPMGMVMCAGQIAPPPPGKSYQLWLVPMEGKPMSLGVFSSAGPGMAMMAHVPPNMEARAFAITVEPLGGMPQPTGPKVLVGVPG
jgi:anti-sigma-K factor RskA